MTTTAPTTDRRTTSTGRRDAANWVAATWAGTFAPYAALALLGRVPHPWRPSPSAALGGLTAPAVSWIILGVAGAVLAGLGVGLRGRAPGSVRLAGGVLVALGVVVAVVVSDVRALAFLGYLPMVLLATAGVGPVAGHLEWGTLLDSAAALGHAAGGVAVALAGVRLLDRARLLAGRGPVTWRSWVRWGRPAVAVAVVAPLVYAATRIAWALGIPLGISRASLDDLGDGVYAGLGLGLFAVVGAVLTTGLLARWGEVFPSWVPVVRGRRVPVGLAVVPGLFVAGAVTAGGLSFWRLVLIGELSRLPGATSDWAAWAPELLWPLWGVALAVATLAYLGRGASGMEKPTVTRAA